MTESKNEVRNGTLINVDFGDNDPTQDMGSQVINGKLHVAYVPTKELNRVPLVMNLQDKSWVCRELRKSDYVSGMYVRVFEAADANAN